MTDAEWLEKYKAWFLKFHNPIFVWQAIAKTRNATPPLPIPDWCLPYLADAAKNISCLSSGWDFREKDKRVSSAQALAGVPQALGLSRGQGAKNAFAAIAELSRDMQHRNTVEVWNDEPRAIAEIASERQITPEHARRRLARVRKTLSQG